MIAYLIKSTLCFVVLFGFYKLALEHKALHHFKRYYLLVSLVFSLVIPLITFTYTTTQTLDEVWVNDFAQAWESSPATNFSTITTPEKTNYLPYILWSLYGIGVLIFGSRFALNLIRLTRKIRRAETLSQSYFTLALLSQTIVPHSFLKYIFLSKKPFQNSKIPPEVIAHEATHVRQKHSLDVLFIEVVQVLFWFNPLFWIAKNSIKLNHEFLADQGAIGEPNNLYHYQNILLDYASSTHHTTLESSFSYSSTKKRILMLSQTFSRKRLFISALLLIPIIAGCILVFNHDIIAKPNSNTASIEGEWLEKTNETQSLSVYHEKDTLWMKFQYGSERTYKIPVIEQKGGFFYKTNHSEPQLKELSIAENGHLKFEGFGFGNGYSYVRAEDAITNRIQGAWVTPDGKTKYDFSDKGFYVIDVLNNKSKRYWPKLIDNGMTFTIGYQWYTFIFKDDKLFLNDTIELKRIENHSVYNRDKQLALAQSDQSFDKIQYAKDFVSGAERNGKKALVISIENKGVYLNGLLSSLQTFEEDINTITKNWSSIDYSNMIPSFLSKNSDKVFIEKVNKAFKKTKLFKHRQDLQFKPIAPKEFESAYVFSSTKKHLEKMKNLKSQFFFNKVEIPYEKALKLITNDNDLSIQTPYPYTNPPQTYISAISSDITETTTTVNEASQRYKAGDTVTFTVVGSQEQHKAVIQNLPLQSKKPTAALLTKWLNDTNYGVWIDGERRDNGSLTTYRPQDFVVYYESKLERNAKNYGQYKIRIDLHTIDYEKKIQAKRLSNQEELKKLYPQITPVLIQEYTQWATKINNERSPIIKGEKLRKMRFVYNELMSPSQRKGVPSFPQIPPPPPIFIDYPEPPVPDDVKTLYIEDNEKVVIRSFYIDSTDVTDEQYREYLKWVNEHFPSDTTKTKKPKFKSEKKKAKAKPQKKKQKEEKGTPLAGINSDASKKQKSDTLIGVKGTLEDIKEEQHPAHGHLNSNTIASQELRKPTRLNILGHLRLMNRHEATFIYKNKEMSFKDVMKLARNDRTLDVSSYIDEDHKKTITYLKKKGWKAVFDKEHKLFRQEIVHISYQGEDITEAAAKELIFKQPKIVDIKILSKTKKEIFVELIDVESQT